MEKTYKLNSKSVLSYEIICAILIIISSCLYNLPLLLYPQEYIFVVLIYSFSIYFFKKYLDYIISHHIKKYGKKYYNPKDFTDIKTFTTNDSDVYFKTEVETLNSNSPTIFINQIEFKEIPIGNGKGFLYETNPFYSNKYNYEAIIENTFRIVFIKDGEVYRLYHFPINLYYSEYLSNTSNFIRDNRSELLIKEIKTVPLDISIEELTSTQFTLDIIKEIMKQDK